MPGIFDAQPDILYHLVTSVSPLVLRQRGVLPPAPPAASVPAMVPSDRSSLEAEIERADGSCDALRAVFDGLVDRLGSGPASQLWWAAFSAQDATET